MISDIDAEKANDYIRDHAKPYAYARGNRIYLEHYRKAKRAVLFQKAPNGVVADRAAWAEAHPAYHEILKGIEAAVVAEEEIKWMMVAAQAKIEMWRTQQANGRRGI
jgi:hypothetical protein